MHRICHATTAIEAPTTPIITCKTELGALYTRDVGVEIMGRRPGLLDQIQRIQHDFNTLLPPNFLPLLFCCRLSLFPSLYNLGNVMGRVF